MEGCQDTEAPSVAEMDLLSPPQPSATRQRALNDARNMQKQVIDMTNKLDMDPPNYALSELIGKGSFGRVYKG